MFDRNTKRDVTLEASRENSKPRAILKPRKVQRFISRKEINLYRVKDKWMYCYKARDPTRQFKSQASWINAKVSQ